MTAHWQYCSVERNIPEQRLWVRWRRLSHTRLNCRSHSSHTRLTTHRTAPHRYLFPTSTDAHFFTAYTVPPTLCTQRLSGTCLLYA